MMYEDNFSRHLNSVWEVYQITRDDEDILESLKVLIKVKEKKVQKVLKVSVLSVNM